MRILGDRALAVDTQVAPLVDVKLFRLRVERVETVLGSRPQPATVIDEQGENGIVTQAGWITRLVAVRSPLSSPRIEAMQASAPRAEPKPARAVFDNRKDDGIRKPAASAAERVGSKLSRLPVDPADDPLTTRPDVAVAVLIGGRHVFPVQVLAAAVLGAMAEKRGPEGKPVDSSAVHARPHGPFVFLEQRQ